MRRFTVLSTLVVSTGLLMALLASSAQGVSLRLERPGLTRVTSQNQVIVNVSCLPPCSGKVTLTGKLPVNKKKKKGGKKSAAAAGPTKKGKPKQKTLGSGEFETPGPTLVGVGNKLLKALKKSKSGIPVKIRASGIEGTAGAAGSASVKTKLLAPLPYASPCNLLSEGEAEIISGHPLDPGQFDPIYQFPKEDTWVCFWPGTGPVSGVTLSTHRGDHAARFIGPGRYAHWDFSIPVSGPWDEAHQLFNADDDAGGFMARRGDDWLYLISRDDDLAVMGQMAAVIIQRFP